MLLTQESKPVSDETLPLPVAAGPHFCFVPICHEFHSGAYRAEVLQPHTRCVEGWPSHHCAAGLPRWHQRCAAGAHFGNGAHSWIHAYLCTSMGLHLCGIYVHLWGYINVVSMYIYEVHPRIRVSMYIYAFTRSLMLLSMWGWNFENGIMQPGGYQAIAKVRWWGNVRLAPQVAPRCWAQHRSLEACWYSGGALLLGSAQEFRGVLVPRCWYTGGAGTQVGQACLLIQGDPPA